MMPGMDPRTMKRMMSQLGIENKELNAKKVIIETENENIVITSPQVTQISMQGQVSYQISGTVSKEANVSDEDVKLVAEQSGATTEQAKEALAEANGDMAQAILKLKKE